MKKDYILFIDSGIGGLSTLSKAISMIEYNYIYYADNKNCPYGNHSQKEIINFLTKIIDKFTKTYQIKFIVIACNTATASAIDFLREKYQYLIFIGTEPAVYFAHKIGFNQILALTTPLTASLNRYKNLCYKSNTNITTLTLKNLVSKIESFYLNQNLLNRYKLLKEVAFILKNAKNYECIVLGCTHYVFLKPFFYQLSKKKLIDGNLGIVNNLIKKLPNIKSKLIKKSTIKIKLSQANKELIKNYKKILSQTLANPIILC